MPEVELENQYYTMKVVSVVDDLKEKKLDGAYSLT